MVDITIQTLIKTKNITILIIYIRKKYTIVIICYQFNTLQ